MNGGGPTTIAKCIRQAKKECSGRLTPKKGVCTFHHHRPFDLTHSEWLHLWMTPDDVEQMLGEPNREFGPRGQGFWYYYGVDGTALRVRFMSGELGEADFDRRAKTWPVDSVKEELAGRSIYEVMAERATKKNSNSQRTRESQTAPVTSASHLGRSSQSQQGSIIKISPSATDAAPPVPAEPIAATTVSALASVKMRMSRDDVLRALGKPSSRFS